LPGSSNAPQFGQLCWDWSAEALMMVDAQVGILCSQRDSKMTKFFVDLQRGGDRASHFFAQQRSIAASKAVDNRF
jgi:hypothetical protein